MEAPTYDAPSSTDGQEMGEVEEGLYEVYDTEGSWTKIRKGAQRVWVRWLWTEDDPEAIREYKKEAQARKARAEELRNQGYGLSLDKVGLETDMMDGVKPRIHVRNVSRDKTIKYIYFTLQPYNPVGDPVVGEMRGYSEKTVRGVGPVQPGEDEAFQFEPVWYGSTISCVEVHRIRVEHTDGSSFTYVNDLADIESGASTINLRGECQ
jgi:hypothetical protein